MRHWHGICYSCTTMVIFGSWTPGGSVRAGVSADDWPGLDRPPEALSTFVFSFGPIGLEWAGGALGPWWGQGGGWRGGEIRGMRMGAGGGCRRAVRWWERSRELLVSPLAHKAELYGQGIAKGFSRGGFRVKKNRLCKRFASGVVLVSGVVGGGCGGDANGSQVEIVVDGGLSLFRPA